MTFTESRLAITFGPSWSVIPFDQSAFFKTLAGQGLKGVDFVGIHNHQLFLFEIKNYTRVKNQALPTPPNAFAFREILVEKFQDSIRVIRIIHATFRRYTVFRWWQWVASHIKFLFLCAPESWIFWTRCQTCVERGHTTFVLLLIDPYHLVKFDDDPTDWVVLRGMGPFSDLPDVRIVPE